MRLIFSHMKGYLIESESCFGCPGVSTLTSTPVLMSTAHTSAYKFECCSLDPCTSSPGHTDGSVFISDKHKIETICIDAHVHKQPLIHWHLRFFIWIGNNSTWYSYIIEFAHTSQLCSLPPPPVKSLDDPATSAFRFFLCCQARNVGVCQKSFQQHPCFWMRALSPVKATSLNKTDKGSSVSQPPPRANTQSHI